MNRIEGIDLREAMARRIRIIQGDEQPLPPLPSSPFQRDETMDSLPSEAEIGPPMRSLTPIGSEDEDEILIEETQPVDRTQGNSEGEEDTEERR